MKNPTSEFDSANGSDSDCGDYFLMELLVQQQPDALRVLHNRYYAALRSIVMQIVHDETDAEDILQEVFNHLWTRPETYCAEKGKPLGWLITLGRRRAIDCLRRRQAYTRATDRFELAEREPSPRSHRASTVERDACKDDLRAYLEDLMGKLPPAQKIAIERNFFSEMSQREIARVMNLPLGTVKTRIELGMRKLAQMVLPARERVE